MLLAAAVIAATMGVRQAPSAPARPSPAPQPAATGQWREAPEYLAVFTPRLYRTAYRAFVTPLGLEPVLRDIAADPLTLHPPGAWQPQAEHPFDAFGSGGTYDRWQLARLYSSRRPQVARGPRGRGDVVDESWTLISPYPSPDMTRLDPGTLLLVLRIP